MAEGAIAIVIQHWIREDNFARIKANQELRQKNACMRIIENRQTILLFLQIWERMEVEGQNPDLLWNARSFAKDLINKEEIFGFCDGCHRGKIRFRVILPNFSRDLFAQCWYCGQISGRWENLFEEDDFGWEEVDDY